MLKVLFYLLWLFAGVMAGLFMRYADAKEGAVNRINISLLVMRIGILVVFILIIGAAMEISAGIDFKDGEMIPAGALCVGACMTTYFWRRRKR